MPTPTSGLMQVNVSTASGLMQLGGGASNTTLIVAASNALNSTGADYVCDGTADDVEIQAAINALPAAGGKVALSEGTFTLAATLTPKNGLTLVGAGVGATTLTLANGTIYTILAVPTAASGTANAAVTTANTTLTDTRATWTVNQWVGYDVTCNNKRLTVTSNTATVLTGAAWTGASNPGNAHAWTLQLPVKNCTFRDFTADGNKAGQTGGNSIYRGMLDLSFLQYSLWDCVLAQNSYDHCFFSYGSYSSLNNKLQSCIAANSGYAGIFLNQTRGAGVFNCDAYGSFDDGINLCDDGVDSSSRYVVVGCRSWLNDAKGLNPIGSSQGGDWIGNTSTYNGSYGLWVNACFSCKFIGNTIKYNTDWGVFEDNNSGYNAFVGNDVSNNVAGDWSMTVTTDTFSGNKAFWGEDTTVASTQAFGDAAIAGTGVLPAKITHKHAMPNVREIVCQTGQGIIAEPFSRMVAPGSTIAIDGTVYYVAIGLLAGDIVTNVSLIVGTVGNTMTLSKVGLYDASFNLLKSSADQGTAWTVIGTKTIALSGGAYTVPSTGLYYLALVAKGTTIPQFVRGDLTARGAEQIGSSNAAFGCMAAQTDLPATITPSITLAIAYWMAAS